jgi:predicted amidohydrolase
MTRLLKIALLHLAPALGALDENRALIESGTRVAAGLGADWVLSGELVVPGYRFDELIGTEWIAAQPDPWLRRLSQLSAELGVVSFASHPERDPSGQLFNSLFVIGRNGRMLGRHRKLHPTPGSEGWATAGELGPPVLVEGIHVGLLVCADAYPRQPALRLRNAGAQLLVSVAAWWPGEWGPNGEWEARTVDTGLPMIVCNRTGHDGESHMIDAESVIVDRGVKLLALRAPDSKVFVVDCLIRDEHIVTCEVAATASVTPEPASVKLR